MQAELERTEANHIKSSQAEISYSIWKKRKSIEAA